MKLQEQISKIKGMMIIESQSSMLLSAINRDMMEIGEEPLDIEEMDDLLGCQEEQPENLDQQQMSVFQKIKSVINSTQSNKPLKDAFKQIKGLIMGKRQQQEQLETMVIMGVSAPVAALIVVGGLLLITILIKMIKNIGGDREYVPSCRQGLKAVRERRFY